MSQKKKSVLGVPVITPSPEHIAPWGIVKARGNRYISDANGFDVCVLSNQHTKKFRSYAHLIVAAPDLLRTLKAIRGSDCQSFTTGLGSCFRNGRTPDAQYGEDRCCDSCIADAAIAKAEP